MYDKVYADTFLVAERTGNHELLDGHYVRRMVADGFWRELSDSGLSIDVNGEIINISFEYTVETLNR
jgi:hypothetical protein